MVRNGEMISYNIGGERRGRGLYIPHTVIVSEEALETKHKRVKKEKKKARGGAKAAQRTKETDTTQKAASLMTAVDPPLTPTHRHKLRHTL